jgi:hypothetical protein
LHAALDEVGRSIHPGSAQIVDDRSRLSVGGVTVLLRVNGFEHGGQCPNLKIDLFLPPHMSFVVSAYFWNCSVSSAQQKLKRWSYTSPSQPARRAACVGTAPSAVRRHSERSRERCVCQRSSTPATNGMCGRVGTAFEGHPMLTNVRAGW